MGTTETHATGTDLSDCSLSDRILCPKKVALYGHALEQLLLDGIKDIAYAAALEAFVS